MSHLALCAFLLASCSSNTVPPTDGAVDLAVPLDRSVPASLAVPDLADPLGQKTLILLGSTDGLGTPVVDASTDEAGNLWVATSDALYVRRLGAAKFRKYTNTDGLHISYGVSAVAGAGPNEGYLGLIGYEDDLAGNDTDEQKLRGKLEHIHLLPDGTITSLHYAMLHSDVSDNYYETRSARRLLYSHQGASAGHLFLGGNHGITHIFNDSWGDHVHASVWWMPEKNQRMGEWFGLAIDPATDGIWTCGRCACGLQRWNPDPRAWVSQRPGYQYAFTVFTGDHALEVPSGHEENFRAAAVTPDGTAWFLSRRYGLASWDPKSKNYKYITVHPLPALGLAMDMVADPDGTLWIADDQHLWRYRPSNETITPFALPVSDLRRLSLDDRLTPRALLISTGDGLIIFRGK